MMLSSVSRPGPSPGPDTREVVVAIREPRMLGKNHANTVLTSGHSSSACKVDAKPPAQDVKSLTTDASMPSTY